MYKKGIKTKYLGISFRSKWEVFVAKLLFYNQIEFKYEPKRHYFNGFSYLPDFYLPDYNCYVEVKGVETIKDRLQVQSLAKTYKVIYINQIVLESIFGKPASYISKIKSIDKYIPSQLEIKAFKKIIDGINRGSN